MESKMSLHLRSLESLTNIRLDRDRGILLVEAELGRIKNVTFVDSIVLEIVGEEGVLRIDISRDEIERYLKYASANGAGCGFNYER